MSSDPSPPPGADAPNCREGWSIHLLTPALLSVFVLNGLEPWLELRPIWVRAVYLLVLLHALFVVTRRRTQRLIGGALLIPGVLGWSLVGPNAPASLLDGDAGARVLQAFTGFASLGYLSALVLRRLFAQRRFAWAEVSSATACFLMIGIAWSGLYAAVDAVLPGSFQGLSARASADPSSHHFLYLSFSTLMTIGYGDIVPVSAPARMLAVLEAVVGQLYLVVIVARVVALVPRPERDD